MKMAIKSMVSCTLQGIQIAIKMSSRSHLESRAICRYLEAKYKGKGTELIPTSDVQSQALFEQAASIEISYFDPSASEIVYERVFKKYEAESSI